MFTVLITGGIGSGKSEVSKYLRSRNVPVYDCDSRTKALYDGGLGRIVEKKLSVSLHNAEGEFDGRELAERIFTDPDCLVRLEGIVHPAVLEDFNGWRKEMADNMAWSGYLGPHPFVCMESAIALGKRLFDNSFDAAVWVRAPKEACIERASRRDGSDADKIKKRIASQDEAMYERADYIIENDGTLDDLKKETDRVFIEMIKKHIK